MNRERLQHTIDAYGADPARWPAAAHGPCDFPSSEEAREAMREAADLDRALDAAFDPVELPPGLRARVLAAAPVPRRTWWQELVETLGGARLAGPVFACALSLGLGLTWLLPGSSQAVDSELDDYLALAWIDPADTEELP